MPPHPALSRKGRGNVVTSQLKLRGIIRLKGCTLLLTTKRITGTHLFEQDNRIIDYKTLIIN